MSGHYNDCGNVMCVCDLVDNYTDFTMVDLLVEIKKLREQLGELSEYKRILDHIYDPYASPEEQERRLLEQLSEYVIVKNKQQRK